MKLRNGFVSNSSSSSFILKIGGRFHTVRDVAQYMIDCKIIEAENYNWKDEAIKNCNKDKRVLKKLKDPNTPVSFASCNYDTYIRNIGDVIMVSTCNNTDWGLNGAPERIAKLTPIAFRTLNAPFLKEDRRNKFLNLDGKLSDEQLAEIAVQKAKEENEYEDVDHEDDPKGAIKHFLKYQYYGEFDLAEMFYDFYSLPDQMWGVEIYDDCPKCGTNQWKDPDGNRFCPKCENRTSKND